MQETIWRKPPTNEAKRLHFGTPFPARLSHAARRVAVSLLLVAAIHQSHAQSVSAAPRVPFAQAAAPVLQLRCVRCHGPTEASGGLRLDSYDTIMQGGERGPVVMPGNSNASLLIRKVLRRDKPAMPPRKPLTGSEIRALAAWIQSGAGP